MGKMKEYLMELEEQASDRHLAKLLGLTYDELTSLSWDVKTEESNEGLIYSYYIEFKDGSPKEILKKINRPFIGNSVYLEPWELDADYDYINDQFDAITETRISKSDFVSELDKLKKLSLIQVEDESLKDILYKQAFISIIGSLENFLYETFIRLVFNDDNFFQNFVETHPAFKIRKFELCEIFQKKVELNSIVKTVIGDTLYHNLPTVRKMYQETFDIKFPSIGPLIPYITTRHDLVHRSGKTKEGKNNIIDNDTIDKLMAEVKAFVDELCNQLGK